jgi:hypothetical protein
MMNTVKKSTISPTKQRGAATLLVAVILLAVMTIGTFFANRSLILDQIVAGNYFRSARAQMAAEAGLEIMNSRLMDKTIRDTILTSSGSRYTGISTPTYSPNSAALGSTASFGGQVTSTVSLANAATGSDLPFSKLRITSLGCWDDSGNASCSPCSNACPSRAEISQIVAFRGGLTGVPSAALTAKGNVDLGGSAITITNTDANTNGLTIHAGGTVSPHSDNNLQTLPGTPPLASVAPSDGELTSLSANDFFENFFGQSKASYRAGADEIISCSGVCNSSVNGKTGKILWIDVPAGGSFNLNSTTTVGSATDPVILVVNGPIELRGSATVYGVVYSTAILWDNTGGGTSQIIGGAIAEGNFTANGTPNPTYDSTILSTLSGLIGSYVKVPGTWRDF